MSLTVHVHVYVAAHRFFFWLDPNGCEVAWLYLVHVSCNLWDQKLYNVAVNVLKPLLLYDIILHCTYMYICQNIYTDVLNTLVQSFQ